LILTGARVWLGAGWSLFQLYTAAAGTFDLLIQLPLHVACAVALGFLTPAGSAPARWWDGGCALLALACGAYYVACHERCGSGSWGGRCPSLADYVIGTGATRGATAAGQC
jgi:TRAP-type uncharacterized transport system fused permease subunit